MNRERKMERERECEMGGRERESESGRRWKVQQSNWRNWSDPIVLINRVLCKVIAHYASYVVVVFQRLQDKLHTVAKQFTKPEQLFLRIKNHSMYICDYNRFAANTVSCISTHIHLVWVDVTYTKRMSESPNVLWSHPHLKFPLFKKK